jgi:hypothetical protein
MPLVWSNWQSSPAEPNLVMIAVSRSTSCAGLFRAECWHVILGHYIKDVYVFGLPIFSIFLAADFRLLRSVLLEVRENC